MIRVFDYQCSEGHKFEIFAKDHTKERLCGCGKPAHKIVSAPAFVLPANAGFPGKDDRWVREHEKAGKGNDVDPKTGMIRDEG